MTTSTVTWSPEMSSLGSAAVAVGVFDGVHLGHQALLRDTVADAARRGIRAIVVTFDRDPDQVVSPSTAAPQLLTLADKLDFIAETGVDIVLVVPFTPALAELAPEAFVDTVLLAAMRPATVHVGRDFRFGARAAGDVSELQRLGLTHNFEVSPHDLVEVDGAPVTSTRIRSLVAGGFVVEAAELLGHIPRVTGLVHRGRGEGAKLGFPTANVMPVPFAALPADGVYAGRGILEDGIQWAAAISVGTPPTFPEARDYLEAHLIAFEGNLYDQNITLEFFEKLRDQEAYGSLEELEEAIADDVAAALEIAGFEDDEDDDDFDGDIIEDPDALAAAEAELAENPDSYVLAADAEFVDDPAAFEAADEAVRALDGQPGCGHACDHDDAVKLVADLAYDRERLLAIEAALTAAGVEAMWEPFAPENAPLLGVGILGEVVFGISVWSSQLGLARDVLHDSDPLGEL